MSAVSIRVYWEPPEQPNGIIESYTLNITDIDTGNTRVFDIIERPSQMIDELMEYEAYVVVVAARTNRGVGNYSDPLNVLTLEHCM